MALSTLAIHIVAIVCSTTAFNSSTTTMANEDHLLHGNSTSCGNCTMEHKSGSVKPLLLSTHSISSNASETDASSSFWNVAHFSSSSDHNMHYSGSSTILVITVFIGFTLTGLFLLWRRHRHSNRDVMCHYTTLDQEVTLSNNLALQNICEYLGTDLGEVRLDMSDDDTPTSSDDEELLR